MAEAKTVVGLVFDGPPSKEQGPRLIKMVDHDHNATSVGVWFENDDATWTLIIAAEELIAKAEVEEEEKAEAGQDEAIESMAVKALVNGLYSLANASEWQEGDYVAKMRVALTEKRDEFASDIKRLTQLRSELSRAIPINVADGGYGIFKETLDNAVENLNEQVSQSETWVSSMQKALEILAVYKDRSELVQH